MEYTGTVIGILDYLNATELAVFPNPSAGQAMVRMDGQGSKLIRVIDVQGRVVVEREMEAESMQMDLGDLTPGMYIVEGRVLATGQTDRTTWIKK